MIKPVKYGVVTKKIPPEALVWVWAALRWTFCTCFETVFGQAKVDDSHLETFFLLRNKKF